MSRTAQSPSEYFWKRVDRRSDAECWPWLGSTICRYGIADLSTGRVRATRLSWMIANDSDWPKGKFACHTCDNPTCVNPAHIWPGTHAENMRDCYAKGRHPGWAAAVARGTPLVRPKPERAPVKVRPTHCVRCGHHRTDDYIRYEGKYLRARCRECNRRRCAEYDQRRRRRRAAKPQA